MQPGYNNWAVEITNEYLKNTPKAVCMSVNAVLYQKDSLAILIAKYCKDISPQNPLTGPLDGDLLQALPYLQIPANGLSAEVCERILLLSVGQTR